MPESSFAAHLPFESTDLLSLPIQPAVAEALLVAFDDEAVTLSKLARIAGCDPVMSARMLAVANSAAFGGRAPRSPNLERTFAVLTPKTVKTIAAVAAIHQGRSDPHGIPTVVLERYWWHALTCAHLARRLAGMTGYPEPEEAYLGGLLHDLGKLVIGVRHAEALTALHKTRALAVLARALSDDRTLAALDHALSEGPALERRLFGVDHCELGAALVETWRLDSFVADAIRFHHHNTEALRGAHPLPRLIHAANTLNQADDRLGETAFASAHILLGLPPELLRKARAETDREIARLAENLGIPAPSPGEGHPIASAPTTAPSTDRIREPSGEALGEVNGSDAESVRPEAGATKTRLGRTLLEIAILNEARGALCDADDEPALLDAIVRCACILFDFGQAHVFLRESATGMLRARETEGLLRELVIDPDGAANAVARAFKERRAHHSLGDGMANPGIADRQLSRLWGTDGVFCLPLHAPNQPLGVLVAGISRARLHRLSAQTRLLESFAATAANRLDRLRQREANRVRVREDRELLQRQRLRAVLHEVSNPLTIVRNYLYLLPIKLGENVAQEELRVLREETERIGRIFGRLTEPDGDGATEPGVDLNRTIRDLAPVLDDTLCRPRGIRLHLHLAETVAPLARGRDAVRQILLNLVRNAVEVLGSGGAITVATQDQINWQGRLYVEIAVADDGPGLVGTPRAKLFQPVTSTKGDGHAGLGLSIVKSLVEDLDGYVGNRPNPSGGTIFMVLLPQACN